MKCLRVVLLIFPAAITLAAPLAWAEVSELHHDLTVRLDPEQHELYAEDSIKLVGEGTVCLTLGPQFSIESITVDGTKIVTERTTSDNLHRLPCLNLQLTGQGRHIIKLHYKGKLTALDETLDHRAVLGQLPAVAAKQGSYLPASSGWYAQLDETTFTYKLALDLPDDQRGLVPGSLIRERQANGRYRAEFEFKHPAEGIELMAGPYQIKELMLPQKDHKTLRLRTYFHPHIAALAPGYLDSISAYLELYNNWIGHYPYSEFSIVSSPLPTGFGFATLTYLGIDVLRLPFIRFGSLGHEVLHNWWGNGVYVDWQRGNWSEGLTTFMADYAYQERASAAAGKEMRTAWLRDFAAIPAGQDQPLEKFTSRSHATSEIVGYHKSAYLFIMLRDVLGTKMFDEGLRLFWKEHQFKTASWADLRHSFEVNSGQNLHVFFEQWLTRSGSPKLTLDGVKIAPPTPANRQQYQVSVTLSQPSPPYTLRVPIVIKTAQGRQEHIVEFSKTQAHYTLESDALPQSLALDPELKLFRQLDPAEIPPTLRQVVTDPATLTVIATEDSAAREVAKLLASKLLDNPPQLLDQAFQLAYRPSPLLIIGTHAAVELFLSQQKLPAQPLALQDQGTAQVWAGQQANGKVVVVVSAVTTQALEALLRPLPHYGQQSFLIFKHNKVIKKGVWPTHASAWTLSNSP